MSGDDFFGHIPRKKKDHPSSTAGTNPPLPGPTGSGNNVSSSNSNMPAIPRKRPVGHNNSQQQISRSTGSRNDNNNNSNNNTGNNNTNNSNNVAIPRKKSSLHQRSTSPLPHSSSLSAAPAPTATGSFRSQQQAASSLPSTSASSNDYDDVHPLDRPSSYRQLKRQISIKRSSTPPATSLPQSSSSSLSLHKQAPNKSPSPRETIQPIATSIPKASSHTSIPATTNNITEENDDKFRLTSNERFRVISENPLVLKIKIHDIVMPPVGRSRSLRKAVAVTTTPPTTTGPEERKKQRSVYQELEDTDSEDYMTPNDEIEIENRRRRKILKKKGGKNKQGDSEGGSNKEEFSVDASDNAFGEDFDTLKSNTLGLPLESNTLPPGEISSLWYSREEFLDIFVLDKVLGWKTRQKVSLYQILDTANDKTNEEDNDNTNNNNTLTEESPTALDVIDARTLQHTILSNPDFYADAKIRMEVSRINPSHCPVVMTLAETFSTKPPTALSESITWNAVGKKYKVFVEDDREEVLLVKWRGRSHIHCSWERASDVQRLDPSANLTARNKIKRYYQTQEMTLGLNWRNLIEEDRKTLAALHGHVSSDSKEVVRDTDTVEEYFSSQSLEVERILGCDESTMSMEVFAKQRGINLRHEQEQFKQKEAEVAAENSGSDNVASVPSKSNSNNPYSCMVQVLLDAKEYPWDPEDNVRYVVKWKGLQYVEMTWEYWKDIKRDAVDEVEDFWYRQQAPDLDEATRLAHKSHPHIRDFKKLTDSRAYGISKRPRPIDVLDPDNKPEEDEPENDSGFKLRSYQLEGVNWLLFNWWNKRSCILADEMGLGKTIQSAAFLQELQLQQTAEVRGPFLIVAPLSLVTQWQSELASWAPDMNVILYHGSADAREFLVREEFYYTEQFVPKANAQKLKKLHVTKFHVLITTFEVILKDIAVFTKIKWKALLVDEAHRLKNSSSKLFEELAAVPRDYCVLLTGTPIANATEELWALLHFANPNVFTEKEDFLMKFGEMTDAKQVNELHSLLKPYLLRRVKEDVEKSLPPKEETILEVSLTPIQKTFYKAIYERNTSFLFKGAKPNNAPSLMNVMMELRKCCNHPFLVQGAEERILNDAAAKLKARAEEEGNPVFIDQYKLFGDQLVKSSGKMVLMEKLLEKLFVDGHKVLIFSQMVRVLDLLEELLKFKKYRYERLDGSTSSSARLHAVERFKKPSLQRFVMLLSTRAGGLGLNLTVASVVIIFDSDWNPQNDLQAMARAHRIGQTKAVRVYRFLTAKTYEMHMFHSASLKLGLERAVLSQNREQGDDNDDNKSKRKTDKEAQAKEIDELLKKGAYDVFRDDDDKEGETFMETDIDQLLAQSSKQVSYGTGASASLGSGLGSFSKASFVANTDDGAKDVDLDDPDFWSKAIGLQAPEELPEDVAAMLDDGVKRSRKQVQVYDPYAETAEAEVRKKEKIAMEKQMEKEEKERQLLEKKKKKDKSKKRHREEKEKSSQGGGANENASSDETSEKKKFKISLDLKKKEESADKKKEQELKTKKPNRKFDKIRAIKRAEDEDPLIERIKQAWEAPHRNRATAAIIRFGFSRFCKIRNESNLSSLPLQDLESFTSSYVYQLSLQFSVTLLSRFKDAGDLANVRTLMQEWLGTKCEREVDWICDSVQSSIKSQIEVQNYRRFLRMPMILAEPSYISDLRRGAAFRAIRRVGILNRLNTIVEEELDYILTSLGHEELGKRGCGVNELSSLDADLKARFVTTEELSLAISANFRRLDKKPPASWWDRSCDVALIVGSFIHGLGNYEAMRNDTALPFAERIRKCSQKNLACKLAMQNFRTLASATRRAFDDALESARLKAELEVQAAVAAAAKAASKREEDAALLRKGGAEAEVAAKNMPQTQVENAFEFDGTDSHFVTLSRMHEYIQKSLLRDSASVGNASIEITQDVGKVDDEMESQDDGAASSGRMKEHHVLPMPDARVLDHRLIRVLETLETALYEEDKPVGGAPHPKKWESSAIVQTNLKIRNRVASVFTKDAADTIGEYIGVGLGGSQCGTSHRSLNDGSDFAFGSASNQLSQVAYGTDAPRFLRAIGVPMNVTRFAINGLAFADCSCVEELLATERFRYYGNRENKSVHKPRKTPVDVGASNELEEVTSSDIQPESDTLISSSPVDPISLIAEIFRANTKLRAAVCMAVMYYGCPRGAKQTNVDAELWSSLLQESSAVDIPSAPSMFDGEKFRSAVSSIIPDSDVPTWEELHEYIENCLLPHCLHLCVSGNGPTTRNARGSQGEYETAFGVSVYPEPTQAHPTPIPDPCLSLQEHSLEALGIAAAMLRRVRLLRSCQYLCSGRKVAPDTIATVTRSSLLGQLSGMPVWWCPWIHDISLLIQAASEGLFSIVVKREDHAVFSCHAVQQFLYSSFVADEKALPAARFTPPEQVTMWTERNASTFPSLNQIEHRLASLCSEATADLKEDKGEYRYHSLPMFDHGGWPRT